MVWKPGVIHNRSDRGRRMVWRKRIPGKECMLCKYAGFDDKGYVVGRRGRGRTNEVYSDKIRPL